MTFPHDEVRIAIRFIKCEYPESASNNCIISYLDGDMHALKEITEKITDWLFNIADECIKIAMFKVSLYYKYMKLYAAYTIYEDTNKSAEYMTQVSYSFFCRTKAFEAVNTILKYNGYVDPCLKLIKSRGNIQVMAVVFRLLIKYNYVRKFDTDGKLFTVKELLKRLNDHYGTDIGQEFYKVTEKQMKKVLDKLQVFSYIETHPEEYID